MVATSKKLGGPSGAAMDYLMDAEGPTAAAYYASDGDLIWREVWGRGAERLGIKELSRQDFARLWLGQSPDGTQLASSGYRKITGPDGTTETTSSRTPAIDATVAAPKSVAELYADSSPEFRLLLDRAMMTAAREAFESMEAYAPVARVRLRAGHETAQQTKWPTERVPAELIAVPVLQYSARPVGDQEIGSPHLHVHTLMFTLCHGEGKWRTADDWGIKKQQHHRDYVFMGTLARELEQLGVEIDYADFDMARNGRIWWEVKGSNPDVRRAWSRGHERAHELKVAYEREHGKPMSDRQLEIALYETRGAKTMTAKAQDANPVWERWTDELRDMGLEPTRFDVHDAPIKHANPMAELHRRLLSPNGLCRDDAVFGADQIMPAVARCAVGLGLEAQHLRDAAKSLDLVLVRDALDDRARLYTTPTQLAAEGRVTARLAELVATQHSPVNAVPEQGLSLITLDPEQRAVMDAVLGGAGLVTVVGEAGTGKSLTLGETVMAMRPAIDRVVVVSTASTTAVRSGKEMHADRAGSVESICRQIDIGSLQVTDRSLVIVDEAAQMDTLRADMLLARTGNARHVLIGDEAQLSSIGPGGWFAKSGNQIALTNVRRHIDPADTDTYRMIRNLDSRAAVHALIARKRLHVAEDRAEKVQAVMTQYADLRQDSRSEQVKIITDGSNHEIDMYNRFVQRRRIDAGEVGLVGYEVHDIEQGRRWELHPGDDVIMLRHLHVPHFGVVKNGTPARLTKVEYSSATMVLDDGTQLTFKLNRAALHQPVGLAYAMHSHKVQGESIDHALVVPSSMTNANAGYSAATRSRKSSHVFIDRETYGEFPDKSLANHWETVHSKHTAIEQVRTIGLSY